MMAFSSLRPTTRTALLILAIAFTAVLTTRTYGQISGASWAYWLGDLGLRAFLFLVGSLILAGVLLDPIFPRELRSRQTSAIEVRRSEKAKWLIIGSFLAVGGLILIINHLGLSR